MDKLALSPYRHPTTICFVDDNESFLAGLDLELPGNWACRTFSDPLDALEFLRRPLALAPLMDRCFSMQLEAPAQAVIALDLNLIEQEINHIDRFRRNSVLVVDYAMPSLNGLELCAEVTDPHIRKAMLTGVADEKIAVEAFNAGLIHRFIPKQVTNTFGVLRQFVVDLEREYFNQYTARLKSALAIDPPGFLVDPVVARAVEELMARESLVEYYLTGDPTGFVMLDSGGRIWRVAVVDPAGLEAQAEYAARHRAPANIATALASGSLIGFFDGADAAGYFGDEPYPWAELTFPAQPLKGKNGIWHLAIWENAPSDIDFDPATASYDAYLRTL